MIEEKTRDDFRSIVNSIKNDIKNTQIKTMLQTNSNLIMLYYRIGKVMFENSKYGNSFNNFSKSLPPLDSDLVNNTIKDPYIFDFLTLKENYIEKELENAMITRIKDVLVELGKGFSFVGNQYKISTANNDYYIDLLFYHLELRCYIVIELKTTEFKPEYIGQLGFYVTAVNETLKKENDNQTIGLLLCKNKDRLTANWSLKSTNVPIGIFSYELDKYLTKDILEKLPTEEDLNLHFDFKE